MKNYLSALLVLLLSIIYVGCGGQTKYYIKETPVPTTNNSVKITLHRNTFSACDWYAMDDLAYGPPNSLIGIRVGSPAPISGMLTNSRYGLRLYYLQPDEEDIYGIVDVPGFSFYTVRSTDSENKDTTGKFMFGSKDLIVSIAEGTQAEITYDTNEKGKRTATRV